MRVKQTQVIRALNNLAEWIRTLPREKHYDEKTENQVEDTVVACLDFMQYSPTTNMDGWFAGKPRRRKLQEPKQAVWSEDGRRAILELITLTISEFEACRPLWPDPIDVGVLPLRGVFTRSAEHVAALQRGRRARRKAERKEKLESQARQSREFLRVKSM